MEDKVSKKAEKMFCVFQEEEGGVIKYNGNEYKDLDTFKVDKKVSELDKILVIRFIFKKGEKLTTD